MYKGRVGVLHTGFGIDADWHWQGRQHRSPSGALPSFLICCHLASLHACSCAGDASSDDDDMASEEDDDEWTEEDDASREQAAAEAEAAELEEKRRQAASRAGACL